MPAPWEKYGQPQQVTQNPMFSGQMQGQGLNNEGQRLTNQERAATVPLARPKAEADLTGSNLGNTRTQQSIGIDRLQAQTALTDKFDNNIHVKRYRTALPEVMKALNAPDDAAGDASIVYSFAKAMDPMGSVREGDTQMAQGTGSLMGRLQSYIGMVNSGKRLPPDARKNLLETMRRTVGEYDRAYINVRKQYSGFAKEGGFDPEQIMGPHDGAAYKPVEMNYLRKAGMLKQTLDPKASAVYTQMFRNGASYEDVAALAQSLGAAPPDRAAYDKAQAQRQAGAPVGNASVFNASQMNPIERAVNSLPIGPADIGVIKGGKQALDRAALGLESAANLLPGIDSHSAEDANAQSDAMFAGMPSDPRFETAGRLGGSALLSAPLRGPMLAGAAGNLLMSDKTDTAGVLTDAGVGAIGGKVGDMALKGVAGMFAPQGRDAMIRLSQEGTQFSPGQIIGGRARTMEDRFTANPVLGPIIEGIREQGLNSANRIPANRALGRVGQTLPDDVPAGHAAVDYTQQALGDVYNSALNGQTISLDKTYISRMNALGKGLNLRPQDFNELADIFQREVGGAFQADQVAGQMSGRTYKSLDENLGDIASSYMKHDDPFKRKIGRALMQVKDQTRALARRQNPQMGQTLRNADEGWADFSILRRAAASNPATGIFSPGQLRTAVRSGDRSVGKGATARGEARMQDLASDMSETLPSTTGSSGTSEREQVNKLTPWALGTALSPLYSTPIQQLIERTLLRKPGPASQRISDTLSVIPRGGFGPLLPMLIQPGEGY